MVQPALLEKLQDLSEDLQSEVLQYVELLLQVKRDSQPIQIVESVSENVEPKPRHGYGSWAGEIMMSDDFDEPLEDLQDYM
jgi:Protein of unknown function (DUF2281)